MSGVISNSSSSFTQPIQYFSNTWTEAHNLFLAAYTDFKKAHPMAECLLQELDAKGASGETLSITGVYLPPKRRSQKNLVIINSGIHGAEAAAGSASLIKLLRSLTDGSLEVPPTTGVFMVHIMNPYGFSHRREENGLQYGAIRVNSHGVDLNRNFKYITNAPSQSIKEGVNSFINPEETSGFAGFMWNLGKCIRNEGKDGLQKAMLNGQYDNPNGCLFGGGGLEQESQIVIDWVKPFMEAFKTTSIIDLHTGYFSSNAYSTMPLSGDVEAARTLFSQTHSNFGDALSQDEDSKGRTFVEGLAYQVVQCGKKVGLGVVVEYTPGLVEDNESFTGIKFQASMLKTLQLTIKENHVRTHETPPIEKAEVTKEYETIFETFDDAWKDQVVNAAKEIFRKVFSYNQKTSPD